MKPKIKIVYLTPWLFAGGAERMLLDLLKNLDRNRFEPYLITIKPAPAPFLWSDELKRLNIHIYNIGQSTRCGLLTIYRLWRILRNLKPDIVHTQLFLADFYGRLAGRLAGCRNIISTEHNLNQAEGYLKQRLKRLSAPLARRVVCVSRTVADYASRHEGLEAGQIKVIYNGVPAEKFYYPGRTYEDRVCLKIGAVGRLTKQKGFDYLISAVALLPADKFSLEIAGEGEDRPFLTKQIQALDLSGRVRLLGPLAAVGEWLKTVDIFVMPSRWEGLGLAALEAGLSGLPIIASAVDGLQEIIADGRDGILFPAGNAEALARAIELLAADPKRRAVLGRVWQEKVRNNFTVKKMSAAYEILYFSLLNLPADNLK